VRECVGSVLISEIECMLVRSREIEGVCVREREGEVVVLEKITSIYIFVEILCAKIFSVQRP